MNTLYKTISLKVNLITNQKLNIEKNSNVKILFNVKGETKIFINDKGYNLNKEDIYFLNRYDSLTIFPSDSLLIIFDIDLLSLNMPDNIKKCNFDCNSSIFIDKKPFNSIKITIIDFIKNINDISNLKATSLIFELFDELYSNFKSDKDLTVQKRTKIMDIIDYIDDNYNENLLLSDIARTFGFSAPYLSKYFKESLGKTFAEFYDEIRIKHSLYDLFETNTTITEISLKHGFPNTHSYIRAYKKGNGVLPSEARKKHQQGHNEIKTNEPYMYSLIDILSQIEETHTEKWITTSYTNNNPLFIEKAPSHTLLGVGSAISLLFEQTKKILKLIQDGQVFKYCIIRGIFDDSLFFCQRTINSQLSFQFSLIDEVLDYIISVNLIPMISLANMPQAIAKKNNQQLFEGINLAAPKKIEEWELAITEFLNHVISRYGIPNVEKWMIIPWFLPSLNNFCGFDSENDFIKFYDITYKTIKKILPNIRILSPEIYINKNIDKLHHLYTLFKQKKCLPDDVAIIFPNIDDFKLLSNNNFLPPKDGIMKSNLDSLINFMKDNNIESDIYVTAFDCTINQKHLLYETLYSPNYYLKNYTENLDKIKGIANWKLISEKSNDNKNNIFSGGPGMYFKNGMPKSIAQALWFLRFTPSYIVDKNDYYLLTKKKEISNHYHLILFNYKEPKISNNLDFSSYNNDPYSLFEGNNKKIIHFKMTNIPFKYALLKMFVANENNGGTYENWIKMGKPDFDENTIKEKKVSQIYKSKVFPDFIQKVVAINDGVLKYIFELNLFEIYGVEIMLLDKLPDDLS